MEKITTALTVLAIFALTSFPVLAGSATASLTVNATVDSACQVTTTAVGFPIYAPLGVNATSPSDSTSGAVTVTCTVGAGSGHILISKGNDVFGGHARMHNVSVSNTYLTYDLYQDASHATVWDDVTGMSISAAPDGVPRTFPIYGRIPSGQNVPEGTYTSVVGVTLNF